MTEDQQMIDTEKKEEKKLILISMGPEDMWNDYLEKINNLMLEEKKLRQTNDGLGGAKKCCEVVSNREGAERCARSKTIATSLQ